MQICSTTLLPCTSSNSRKDLWSCYRCKSHANTLLQNYDRVAAMYVSVLLPYEFTLLQNLKKRHSKLLPVYVSQDIQLHFIISLPFFQKNILSAMLVQICSTTLRFCTSSGPQRDIWSCYRRKMHAITLLQNTIKDYLTLLFVLLPYEFTLLQNELINAIDLMVVLLPCKFTLLQNLKRRLKLLPVHVSQDIQLHLIISPPFCQKHIDYHIYARLFNYPAILHLFKCLNRHLKLLPAQNARNYTTPKR